VIERLLPFDIICVMRERTPLPRNVVERLPNLKLIASTDLETPRSTSLRLRSRDRGFPYGYRSDPTIDLTWALILPVRATSCGEHSLRSGGWQRRWYGAARKTLGVLGLGRIGQKWPESAALLAWIDRLESKHDPEAAQAAVQSSSPRMSSSSRQTF